VIQGAFILAKAKGGPDAAIDCLGHLRRYIELLFAKREGPAAEIHDVGVSFAQPETTSKEAEEVILW
jgi:TetR/AcrR family transcriptional regulator, transcriptional repressor for nem operon